MKQLPNFSGCAACLILGFFLAALGSSPVIAADVCDKKPDLPECNPDPDPDPDLDPVDPGVRRLFI